MTYLGPGVAARRAPWARQTSARELELGEAPIVLTVSAKRPHKNLERLFEAFSRLEPATRARRSRVRDLVRGRRSRREGRRAGAVHGLARGRPARRPLSGGRRAWSSRRSPRASGCPCSMRSSAARRSRRRTPRRCPEVAGDAALYFDPEDTDAIAAAIAGCSTDKALRERLSAAGPTQAAKFSWARTAEGTLRATSAR